MKKNQFVAIAGMLILFLFSFNAGAQSMKNGSQKMSRVLADTTFLRAMEVTLEPGEKTEMHTHPANFVYALSEGKMTVHYKDGKDQTIELKPGMAAVGGPEGPHITENVGKTTVKFLVVELQEHPYQAQK